MVRLLAAAAIAVAAIIVAALIERRRRHNAPTQPAWAVPAQLDRTDFPHPAVPWLIAVFSSATCTTCARVVEVAEAFAGDDVEVVDIEVGASPSLHRRYRIDAVPITVVADRAGVVRADFVGPVTGPELGAVIDRLRAEG